jgi:glycosyltransferase involved in cell wall biosynthesis
MKTKKVLFIGQLPEDVSPSQRFRIELYKGLMKENGIEYFFQPFISKKYAPYLYKEGHTLKKIVAVINGFLNRFAGLFRYTSVDYVFVQREAAPIGPPIFEWCFSKLLRKKLIYDFDDAIWMHNVTENNKLAGNLKCFWKVKYICKWSHKVSVGNEFLAQYAKQFNSNVVYNPTCVDTANRFNRTACQNSQKITIGWTGSHSTLQFLEQAIPALKQLELRHSFRFLVICNEQPSFDLQSLDFIYWKKDTEIEDLLQMNIGIMPSKNDEWNEGKCGFKIIQYLSLGIPAVASPVGVNKKIIDDGINGFLCSTEEEWIDALSQLLNDENMRVAFGEAGRKKMKDNYSLTSNAANFLSLFSN